MATLTAGETLDENGSPIPGTGFEYDSDGAFAGLLAKRISPVYSSPLLGEYGFALEKKEQTNGEYVKAAGIFPPGNLGPPEHIHPGFDEKFEVISGNFIILVDGKEHNVGPGDVMTVNRGTRHTFRCVGNEYGILLVETRPAARLEEIALTLFGLAHEGKARSDGAPRFLQGMVIGEEYSDDFALPFPPPSISKILIGFFAPIARLLGYQATAPRYLEDSFWLERVNQPPK